MKKYRADSRVSPAGKDSYWVQIPNGKCLVSHNTVLKWCCYRGPNLDLVPVEGGGFAAGIKTADNAIGLLIGEPR